jgi:selenocysteine lyase/cysteine desulfurase
MDVDVQEIGCHGLTATGRKFLRAPRGSGFLFVQKSIADALIPSHVDHACAPISKVPTVYPCHGAGLEEMIDFSYKKGAARFEFWESSIANKLGLGEAVRYATEDIGIAEISKTIHELSITLRDMLEALPNVQLHHGDSPAGIITFMASSIDAVTVKERLWSGKVVKFEVSVVPATSTPLDSAHTHVPDLVRASVSYTTTIDDIEMFVEKLASIIS